MEHTITLEVPGMTCGHCESAVKSEVGKVDGVSFVEVNLDTKIVTIKGNDLAYEALVDAVDEAGFDVERP